GDRPCRRDRSAGSGRTGRAGRRRRRRGTGRAGGTRGPNRSRRPGRARGPRGSEGGQRRHGRHGQYRQHGTSGPVRGRELGVRAWHLDRQRRDHAHLIEHSVHRTDGDAHRSCESEGVRRRECSPRLHGRSERPEPLHLLRARPDGSRARDLRSHDPGRATSYLRHLGGGERPFSGHVPVRDVRLSQHHWVEQQRVRVHKRDGHRQLAERKSAAVWAFLSQMRRLCVLAALALAAMSPPAAFAAGETTHAWMADEAIDSLPAGPLQSLLSTHRLEVLSGAGYPDTGYWVENGTVPVRGDELRHSDDFGEESHWERFINAYVEHVRSKDCGDLASATGPCAPPVAHLPGAAAHAMGDEVWDWLFEPPVTHHGGDAGKNFFAEGRPAAPLDG